MPFCVLDCSFAMASIMPDELSPPDEVIRQIALEGAVSPPLWPFESANAVLVARRRGRLAEDDMHRAIELLRRFDVRIDTISAEHVWSEVLPLAVHHGLTAYDATYLHLAIRRQLPLATRDTTLARAARSENLPTL